ncbi:hypothetical protein [Lysobacter gummosus]
MTEQHGIGRLLQASSRGRLYVELRFQPTAARKGNLWRVLIKLERALQMR